MAHPNTTPRLAQAEEALTVLFCLVDDAYRLLNPGWQSHEARKKLSDSEVLALALFRQLRSTESEGSFLRDAQRYFSHLFPGGVGLAPKPSHGRRYTYQSPEWRKPLSSQLIEPSEDTP